MHCSIVSQRTTKRGSITGCLNQKQPPCNGSTKTRKCWKSLRRQLPQAGLWWWYLGPTGSNNGRISTSKQNITEETYFDMILHLRNAVKRKSPGKLSQGIFFYCNIMLVLWGSSHSGTTCRFGLVHVSSLRIFTGPSAFRLLPVSRTKESARWATFPDYRRVEWGDWRFFP